MLAKVYRSKVAIRVEKAWCLIWFIEISRLHTYGLLSVEMCSGSNVRPVITRDITDLEIRIREAIQSTDRSTLSKARDELLCRLDITRVNRWYSH
jgi:hypothetical protein